MELHIFDFDNTLFRSPHNTPENLALYEEKTGIPWVISKELSKVLTKKSNRIVGMRSGWWGRAETLKPPFIPDPVAPEMWIESTVVQFLESKNSKNTTVMMTGRPPSLKSTIMKLFSQANLINTVVKNGKHYQDDGDVTCIFRGENGPDVKCRPKPLEDTLSWKLWIIEKYLDYQQYDTVRIWEDREEHIAAFSSLNGSIHQKVIVTPVIE